MIKKMLAVEVWEGQLAELEQRAKNENTSVDELVCRALDDLLGTVEGKVK